MAGKMVHLTDNLWGTTWWVVQPGVYRLPANKFAHAKRGPKTLKRNTYVAIPARTSHFYKTVRGVVRWKHRWDDI